MSRRSRPSLDQVMELPVAELKAEWTIRYKAPVPNISPELLRIGLIYKLEERRFGEISRSTRSLLSRVGVIQSRPENTGALPRKLTPGTRLVRDWHGTGYAVTVLEQGFEYDGRTWRSLTAIAREITGTHWNGPQFFGLSRRTK